MRTFVLLLAAALAAAPAQATSPAPAPHGAAPHAAPASHGEPAHAGQADAGHGGDEAHGDAAGGHGGHSYTADDDHDGTANWLDSDSEQYMAAKLGFHAFNLIIFIALIATFVRRPAADAVRGRALDIRKTITDSARARDEARDRHEEVNARLARLEDEIAGMRATAEADAKIEAEKMIERARAETVRIAALADRNIRDEIARARLELQRDAADLAIQLAENTLKGAVAAEDQERLAREFLASLNRSSADA